MPATDQSSNMSVMPRHIGIVAGSAARAALRRAVLDPVAASP
jgi:hypothetical protein